jgi:hypothetical protein
VPACTWMRASFVASHVTCGVTLSIWFKRTKGVGLKMLSSSLRDFLQEATGAYVEQRTPDFWEYVESRNLNEDQVDEFSLGLVDEPLPGHEMFRDHVCIPYLTPNGTVGMKFRNLDENAKQKYNSPAGQPHHLYNVRSLWSSRPYVTIVEGEFDTIAADWANLNPIGISGTSGWKEYFARCIKGFATVYVVLDNDRPNEDDRNPGQDAARKLCERLPNARNIVLPVGVDISEYASLHSSDALSKLVLGDGDTQ